MIKKKLKQVLDFGKVLVFGEKKPIVNLVKDRFKDIVDSAKKVLTDW